MIKVYRIYRKPPRSGWWEPWREVSDKDLIGAEMHAAHRQGRTVTVECERGLPLVRTRILPGKILQAFSDMPLPGITQLSRVNLTKYWEELHHALERELVDDRGTKADMLDDCRRMEARLLRVPSGDEYLATARHNAAVRIRRGL